MQSRIEIDTVVMEREERGGGAEGIVDEVVGEVW
jgi:hypothetical protein